jgi:acetate kinase
MKILILNSGSSSQKSCVYEIAEALPDSPPSPVWDGKIEWQGRDAMLRIRGADGKEQTEQIQGAESTNATKRLLAALTSGSRSVLENRSPIDVVGHRIVNGGAEYTHPVVIDAAVKASIERMAVFAPLHNRVELEGIQLVEQVLGSVRQVAVFDTGFHSQMPDAAAIYPGPYEWVESGIRRYGFHGINHQYCAQRAAQILGRELNDLRLVSCHLGNGCSLAAIRDGHSIDTTMGFTPLDGLMMGTRSGSVDPGILTFLMRKQKLTGEQLDELLNKQSGLLGISGWSSDMREIVQTMKQGNLRAKLAFDIFVHRLRSGIAVMVASLSGIEALVFTAGIGENSPEVRAAACANLGFLGVTLDAAKNHSSRGDQDISTRESQVRVLVLRAQEDWAIARECWKLLHTA